MMTGGTIRKNGVLQVLNRRRRLWIKRACKISPACYPIIVKQKEEKTLAQKKKSNSKAYAVSFLVMGAVLVLYSLIFQFYRWQHYLIAAGVAVLIGRIAFIMAQGLDTSKQAPVQRPIEKTGNQAVDSLVEKGLEMLSEIREEDDLIPDPVLSGKIVKLEDVANRIFRTVADQPGKAPQIRRFMDYYLPTTLKMLRGYRKMDERQVTGKNADETRKQVQEAMDVILNAFDRQLDTMYQDDMLDISTDIEVLETMLRQDGLVDSGLRRETN